MTTILITLYNKLCYWIPDFRKLSRKWMYQAMGHYIKQDDWKFMNYGYAHLEDTEKPPVLFTDFRKPYEIEDLEGLIAASGLEVLTKRNITPNVLKALDEDHDRRMQTIVQHVPKPFISQFYEFARVRDSIIYSKLEAGGMIYLSYVMRKTF